jgi:hypothetical protein
VPSPEKIVHSVKRGPAVVGWKLDSTDRERLLVRFRPRYPRTVADHVTFAARVATGTGVPDDTTGEVVGRVDDGRGVEALVVAIRHATARPGGGTYHITWSLEDGRRPKESNDVLAERGWDPISPPVPIKLTGARI